MLICCVNPFVTPPNLRYKKQCNTVECLKVEYDVFCYYEIDGLYYGIKGLYIWFCVHWHINLFFISEGFCPWAIVSSISFQEEEKNIILKMHLKTILPIKSESYCGTDYLCFSVFCLIKFLQYKGKTH